MRARVVSETHKIHISASQALVIIDSMLLRVTGAQIGAGFGGNFHSGGGRKSGGDAWKQVGTFFMN